MTTKKKKDLDRLLAVALKYRPTKERAPRVTAKGKGLIAQKILEIARQHKVPIEENADLVQLLGKLNVNTEIPPELYKVVAEILVFIYATNQKTQGKSLPPSKRPS